MEQVEFEMPARSLAENVQWAVEYMAYILDERCGLDIYVWKSSFIQSFIYKKKKKKVFRLSIKIRSWASTYNGSQSHGSRQGGSENGVR